MGPPGGSGRGSLTDYYVVIISEGWGEGMMVVGVYESEPSAEVLAQAKKQFGSQFARWERFPRNQLGLSLSDGR